MKRLLIAGILACSSQAAESFRMASTTAARQTNAVVCLLSWNASPEEFEVVHYSVYQAEAVEGPYTLIANSDTNEMLLVVEPGTHFWNVRAIRIWNNSNIISNPSTSVGMLDTQQPGLSVKKIHPRKTEELPKELLIPIINEK